jgi:prevent-host-death family protein
MASVSIFQAKSTLSKLLERLESGDETEIVITRHNRPVARLTRVRKPVVAKRIGAAKGRFTVPENIDEANEEILAMFQGRPS